MTDDFDKGVTLVVGILVAIALTCGLLFFAAPREAPVPMIYTNSEMIK